MKQTEQYQLSQWEQEDRILREDFNANNAKIDTALNGQAEALAAETAAREAADTALAATNAMQKLKEVTLTAAGTTVDIDLSDIDFSQYHCIELFFEIELSNPSASYVLIFNHLGSGYYARLDGAYSNTSQTSSALSSIGNFTCNGASAPGSSTAKITMGRDAMLVHTSSGCWNWANNGLTAYYLHDALSMVRLVPENWNTLTLMTGASYTIQSGGKISVYGLKK